MKQRQHLKRYSWNFLRTMKEYNIDSRNKMKLHRIMWWSIYRKRPQFFYWLYLCDFIALHIKKWFISPPFDLGLFWPIECSRSEVPVLKLTSRGLICFYLLELCCCHVNKARLTYWIMKYVAQSPPLAPANTQKQSCLPHLQLTKGTCGSPCGTKVMCSWEEPSS